MLLRHLQARQDQSSNHRPCRVLGIMTGTSLDGVDLALVSFERSSSIVSAKDDYIPLSSKIRVEKFATLPYPDELIPAVTGLLSSHHNASADRDKQNVSPTQLLRAVCQLNTMWSRHIGKLVNDFLKQQEVDVDDVVIACHGQTLWHVSDPPNGSTLQIGDTEVLAHVTNRTVVGNFRAADVACGGTGAPLVPFLDRFLALDAAMVRRQQHQQEDKPFRRELVFLQNLGGIGNVTAVLCESSNATTTTTTTTTTTQHGKISSELLVAFDTGPACVILNELIAALANPAGTLAQKISTMLVTMNSPLRRKMLLGEHRAGKSGGAEFSYSTELARAFRRFVSKKTKKEEGCADEADVGIDPLPTFDKDGFFSTHGVIMPALLGVLMKHPFFDPVHEKHEELKTTDEVRTTIEQPQPSLHQQLAFLGGRSTGREQFGHAFVTALLARPEIFGDDVCDIDSFLQRFCDLCRTAVEMTVRSVALHIGCATSIVRSHYNQHQQRCARRKDEEKKASTVAFFSGDSCMLLCSGGGSRHPLIMEGLSSACSSSFASLLGGDDDDDDDDRVKSEVFEVARLSDYVTISGLSSSELDDAKEALAFAVLGHEKLCSMSGSGGNNTTVGGTNEPVATRALKRCWLGQVSSPS